MGFQLNATDLFCFLVQLVLPFTISYCWWKKIRLTSWGCHFIPFWQGFVCPGGYNYIAGFLNHQQCCARAGFHPSTDKMKARHIGHAVTAVSVRQRDTTWTANGFHVTKQRTVEKQSISYILTFPRISWWFQPVETYMKHMISSNWIISLFLDILDHGKQIMVNINKSLKQSPIKWFKPWPNLIPLEFTCPIFVEFPRHEFFSARPKKKVIIRIGRLRISKAIASVGLVIYLHLDMFTLNVRRSIYGWCGECKGQFSLNPRKGTPTYMDDMGKYTIGRYAKVEISIFTAPQCPKMGRGTLF